MGATEPELAEPFKVGSFKEGKRVKTAKPQKRQKKVRESQGGAGRDEVSEPNLKAHEITWESSSKRILRQLL